MYSHLQLATATNYTSPLAQLPGDVVFLSRIIEYVSVATLGVRITINPAYPQELRVRCRLH